MHRVISWHARSIFRIARHGLVKLNEATSAVHLAGRYTHRTCTNVGEERNCYSTAIGRGLLALGTQVHGTAQHRCNTVSCSNAHLTWASLVLRRVPASTRLQTRVSCIVLPE